MSQTEPTFGGLEELMTLDQRPLSRVKNTTSPRVQRSVRPRDSQRQKLYDAERAAFGSSDSPRVGRRIETIPEIWTHLDKLMTSGWFKRRWPKVRPPSHPAGLMLKDGRRTRKATGGYFSLNLPVWSRSEYVILHELAHHVSIRSSNEAIAWHGREFAAVYLELVGHVLGNDARKALKAEMVARGVKHTKKRTITLTPEQREITRDRLALAREKRAKS